MKPQKIEVEEQKFEIDYLETGPSKELVIDYPIEIITSQKQQS